MLNESHKALSIFARAVVKNSKAKLRRSHRDTGNLEGSIGYDLKVHANSFSLSFYMDEYGAFVDEGVQGKRSSSKAPQSPFKFGTGTGKKGGLTKGIDKWVQRKGIQFRDKNGKFLSYKSTAFIITRSIYNKGIKPSLFFTKPFEKAFLKMPEELIEQFGLDIDEFLEQTITN